MDVAAPSKKIFDSSDLVRFRRSLAFKRLQQLLDTVINKVKGYEVPQGVLNEALVTRKRTAARSSRVPSSQLAPPAEESKPTLTTPPPAAVSDPRVTGILQILSLLDGYIDDTPPREGPRRFGNMAFRDWHAKLEENLPLLVENVILPQSPLASTIEVETSHYLKSAFGLSLRLDYGTGHELSFLAFVGGCLPQFISAVSGPELLTIFAKYYDVVRRLILVYNLEPAGSHGVWGLDDHFHLIYILGAAQFNPPTDKATDTSTVPPVSLILTAQSINAYKLSNLYVSGIAFIYMIKLGPFNEHSPIIFDIHSTVTLWSKVLSGLIKMYEVEVFGKFPVVQHFWFGNALYPWKDMDTLKDLPVYMKSEENDSDKTSFLDGTGVRTTKTNISMTGAPWARR